VRLIFLASDIGVFYFTLCRMDALAMGAVIALIEISKGKLHSYRKIFLSSSLLFLVILIVFHLQVGGQGLDYVQAIKFLIISAFYISLIGYLVSGVDNSFTQWINHRFLRFSGEISYGLYVFHPLGFLISQSLPVGNFWVKLIISFLLSYLIAYLCHQFYEKPFLRLKKYFSYS
jgi:peptidoglycan/LPS O-acetylase OafA/YrhL